MQNFAIKKQLGNPFVCSQNQQALREIIEPTDGVRAFGEIEINFSEHVVVKLIPNKLRKHIVGFV
jgi:hypothetical protein